VLFSDSARRSMLFRVDVGTLACTRTRFTPGDQAFVSFGMGFANDPATNREHLYVAQADGSGDRFGSLDTETYAVAVLGRFSDATWHGGELTGTGDGHLYGFSIETDHKSKIVEIDRNTGAVKRTHELTIGRGGDATAFAHWRGDFFV